MFMSLLCPYSNTLVDDLHSLHFTAVYFKFTDRFEVMQVTKGRDVLRPVFSFTHDSCFSYPHGEQNCVISGHLFCFNPYIGFCI